MYIFLIGDLRVPHRHGKKHGNYMVAPVDSKVLSCYPCKIIHHEAIHGVIVVLTLTRIIKSAVTA